MKRIVFLLIIVAAALSITGCSDNSADIEESSEEAVSVSESSEENDESSSIKTVSSSLTSPLKFEEWGSAAKFSTADQKYYNIPIRVTSVTSGAPANKMVEEFFKDNKSYSSHKPENGWSWAVAEYEMDITGFPIDKSGTDASITAFITGIDGGSIEYNGKKYAVTAINMTDDTAYFEGIHKGSIAFDMPDGFKDYMVILGEFNETQAFFTQSSKTAFS